MRLSSLFQRIGPIDDRSDRPGLNQLGQGKQIFDCIARCPGIYALFDFLRTPSNPNPPKQYRFGVEMGSFFLNYS